MKKRIVIAGFGDTGLLTAINIANKHADSFDIIGISAKPCLVSGQELGTRLSQPDIWKKSYLKQFDDFLKLDGVSAVHGKIIALDPEKQNITVQTENTSEEINYDALLLSPGVTNGFWRNNDFIQLQTIEQQIAQQSEAINDASNISIIGAGPSGCSTAANIKQVHPEKKVDLYYGGDQILKGYHPKTISKVENILKNLGVTLHPGHRAVMPEHIAYIPQAETVKWQTGQTDTDAELVIWATGRLSPNTDFVPADMLNEQGFIKADKNLRVPGYSNIFTVGDVADTDANRSSARNAGFLIAAHNIACLLLNKPEKMKTYKASKHRWGSILGIMEEGMRVFTPTGGNVRVNQYLSRKVLFPFFVWKMIYKGLK